MLDGNDCISTDCQSSVLGENSVEGTPKESLLLSAMGGDISKPESSPAWSRMLSSNILEESSSKYFWLWLLVSTVNGAL